MANRIDLQAAKKWNAIPQEFQKKILENVFCTHCREAVAIVDYDINDDRFGIVLDGKCKMCGETVARLVEKC